MRIAIVVLAFLFGLNFSGFWWIGGEVSPTKKSTSHEKSPVAGQTVVKKNSPQLSRDSVSCLRLRLSTAAFKMMVAHFLFSKEL
jgi:hypothetical protein